MTISSNVLDLMGQFKTFLLSQNESVQDDSDVLTVGTVKAALKENKLYLFKAVRLGKTEDILRLSLHRSMLKDSLIELLECQK